MLKTSSMLVSVPVNPYKEWFTGLWSLSMDFAKVKLECLDHNADSESYHSLQATTLNQQSGIYGSV